MGHDDTKRQVTRHRIWLLVFFDVLNKNTSLFLYYVLCQRRNVAVAMLTPSCSVRGPGEAAPMLRV